MIILLLESVEELPNHVSYCTSTVCVLVVLSVVVIINRKVRSGSHDEAV